MMGRSFFSILLAGAVVLTSASAFAQNQAAADALFRSAQTAAEAGDWRTACDRFEESLRLEPAPGTILNIARCREKLGQWATAWNRYSEAKEKLPPSDPRAKLAEKKTLELVDKVPHVTLVAPQTSETITVRLGNVQISSATFGVPLPVDPGSVEVIVSAEGREPWKSKLEVEVGANLEVKLELGAKKNGAQGNSSGEGGNSGAKERTKDGESGGSIFPYFLIGGGVVGIGAGVVFNVMAGAENTTVQAHCLGSVCDKIGHDAAGRGATLQTAEIIAFSAGAVLAGLGVYFLVSDSKEPESAKVGVTSNGSGVNLVLGGNL